MCLFNKLSFCHGYEHLAALILVVADALQSWLEKHVKSDKWINIIHELIEGINTIDYGITRNHLLILVTSKVHMGI